MRFHYDLRHRESVRGGEQGVHPQGVQNGVQE